VQERIRAYEMPPEGKDTLDFGTHDKLMSWLDELPKPERTDCEQIASDRNTGYYRGYVMSRRLNRSEYNNSLRDLFRVDLQLEEMLPADGGGGEGFDTSGNALFISSIHIEKYLAAASKALNAILPGDPRGNNWGRRGLRPYQEGKESNELVQARNRLLTAKPSLFTHGHAAAKTVLTTFARRAFRRPTSDDEIEHLLTLFDRAYARGDGYVPALRQSLKAVLVSPHFLFLAEPEPATGGVQRLAAFPLASRLSYFLWSSMPDEELFQLAESGRLLETNVFEQQVTRMLADPKAEALGQRFAVQWLNLDRLGTEVHPDPTKFPEFSPQLNSDMRREAVTLFNYVLHGNRSLLELLDCDYTFVNQRLAEIYGIDGVSGAGFQQVSLTDRNRGGVLGMAGIAALTSFPTRTSPVLRGKWVMEALLGEKVNPPPPDVPALDESKEKISHATLRAQLETHSSKPECASCHDKMDPLGFGLENFDVLGRWRDTDRGLPIDARGKLPSGATYVGPAGLKSVLMARKDEVMHNLVKKMVGFAYGRELNKFDECVVDKTMKALKENNYQASVLIQKIATSYSFQHRFYPKENLAYDSK
jgi:hypothetical protein